MKFGTKHNYAYGLILASSEVGAPEPKTDLIDIPGGDGSLDYTEYFGDVKYKDRTIKLTFLSLTSWASRFTYDAVLKNELHGQKMNIVFDDDANYYWIGRLRVGAWLYHKGAAKITITAVCDPYKYKKNETVVAKTLSSTSQSITLLNERKKVTPFITSANAVTFTIDGAEVVHAAGTDYQLSSLVLPAGGKTISAVGDGSISFRYREGSL